MRLWLLAAVVAVGCHRRHRPARRERDPRDEFATGCVDPRYVTAPTLDVPAGGAHAVRAVATARVGAQRFLAWSADEGVFLWREGAAASVRVASPARDGLLALAATSQRALLAWVDAGSVTLNVASFEASGSAAAWPPVASGVAQPALAAGRGAALLAWTEGEGGGATLWARALVASGAPAGESFALARGAVDRPAVAWTGSRFVAAWRERRGGGAAVRARTVSADGAALGEPFDAVRVDGALGPPSIAWGGGRLAVAWSDTRNGSLGLQVATVDLAGTAAAEPQRMSIRFEPEARASMAWDGGAFGVGWWETVGGAAPRAYFALVDRAGRRVGTPMRFWTDGDVGLTATAVDWERPNYVAVAARGDGVELRRTGPRGCDMYLVPAPPEGPPEAAARGVGGHPLTRDGERR